MHHQQRYCRLESITDRKPPTHAPYAELFRRGERLGCVVSNRLSTNSRIVLPKHYKSTARTISLCHCKSKWSVTSCHIKQENNAQYHHISHQREYQLQWIVSMTGITRITLHTKLLCRTTYPEVFLHRLHREPDSSVAMHVTPQVAVGKICYITPAQGIDHRIACQR